MNPTDTPAARLRAAIAAPQILVAPGCYDALSANLIERAGFAAAYLSGASIAYTRFGRPDIGLVGMSEVAETVSQIRERVELPLIVDGDTGFGNALNVQRTVRLFERCGASAIQLEDQQMPKRCGHLSGKTLVSAKEMAGKIRAACDARALADTVIIGRTDALAVEGIDAALDRAGHYLEAGADVLFVEALPDVAAMQTALARFRGRAPLLANMVEGGKSPLLPAAELEKLGFSLAIFPGAMVRVQTFAAQRYLETLRRDGTTSAMLGEMLDFAALNELLGTAAWLERGKKYE
ncbi:MAG: isocitrate lyase/phosphoenolpyruvate mutase family protein [Steroidobacteraceae bacterium]|nr:isocitrate lyase/phosphoenolpyruvate mutase family protein [Steroidobacteraceae bacterium]